MWYLFVAFCVIACDVVTKQWALKACVHELVFNQFVACQLVINRGVSWSLLHYDSFTGFTLVTALVGGVVMALAWHAYGEYRSGRSVWGEVFVLAGAVSNLIDRFIYGGVIDFIKLSYQDYIWPIFNIADAAIVCGVMLMLYKLCKTPEKL